MSKESWDKNIDDTKWKQVKLIKWATDVAKLLELSVSTISIKPGGQVFQQTIGISMWTHFYPFLADVLFF